MKRLLPILLCFFFSVSNLYAGTFEMDWMEYASDADVQTAYVTNGPVAPTGGSITIDGAYTLHTFTEDETFTPNVTGNVRVLVIGGGGGGGIYAGGGGGGGGMVYNSAYGVTANTGIAITIGRGGNGNGISGSTSGENGVSTVFGVITAVGGGGGAQYNVQGVNGGSGGGAGQSPNFYNGGTATQGTSGGGTGYGHHGGSNGSIDSSAGGGGGAGAVGVDAISGKSGNGGAGLNISDINTTTYAGGGGGGTRSGTRGYGVNGGGDGGDNNGSDLATAGTPNTGGGGGGGGGGGTCGGPCQNGKAGGSGIVIVKYLTADFLTYPLQPLSESSIKSQGTHSLKGVASMTSGLNKTLTRTFTTTKNLMGLNLLKFSIYASRTGQNIQIGMHDTGGTTTVITPDVANANTWQTVIWDISAVDSANRDAIDQLIITVV